MRRGFTMTELSVVIVLIAALLVILIPVQIRLLDRGYRSACAGNLKQFAQAFSMYASENIAGKYPTIHHYESEDAVTIVSAPNMRALYPKYLPDPAVLICPKDDVDVSALQDADGDWSFDRSTEDGGTADKVGASYVYWGWLLEKTEPEWCGKGKDQCRTPQTQLSAADAALLERPEGETVYSQPVALFDEVLRIGKAGDLIALDDTVDVSMHPSDKPTTTGNGESGSIRRLALGVERFAVIADGPGMRNTGSSILWAMYEAISPNSPNSFRHAPNFGLVLFLDGHVEAMPYPSAAPMTEGMAPFLNGFVVTMKKADTSGGKPDEKLEGTSIRQ